jgi:hypothetical protein
MVMIKPRGTAIPKAPSDYDLLRARIKIDRDALDKSVEEQAQVFLEVCDRHVHALSLRDEARDALSRKDAEIAREVRQNGEKSGSRVTEANVNDSVMLHPDHIRLSAILAEIKKQSDLWGVLRDAFDQRMRMIRELVNLYAVGYYGSVGTVGPRNTVRDSLAATARTKLDEDRKIRRQ